MGCVDDKLFCTHDWIWTDDWILCSALARYVSAGSCGEHTWLEQARRIIWRHFRHTPIQLTGRHISSSLPDSNVLIWARLKPELLDTRTGEVKHWWRQREYSISGSLEIQDMVRGYSFDIRFTLGGNIQSGYSEHGFPSSTHTRAHLVPNQGSSRPAFASRLKWDRVSLMGIRVEFETKCQCLYWSLIESLGKQKFAASDHPESPFLQKVGSGSGPTVSFPLIWLWQTGQPLAGC